MKEITITVLGLSILLAGCATTPSSPYWVNPQWVNALAQTIQTNILYPEEAIKNTLTTENFPYGQAIVQFTYDDGRLTTVQIVKSTGHNVLDEAIASEIPDIKPPLAEGQSIEIPHRFELAINIGPPDYPFFKAIHDELQKQVKYPRLALLKGEQGSILAVFQYENGEVLDARIIRSSHSRVLDASVLNELENVTLPKPPSLLQGKVLDLSIAFNFGVLTPGMDTVLKMRYVPTSTTNTSSTAPCAEVGFKYQYWIISNVHLIESSGNLNFDKQALSEASAGKLLPSSAKRIYGTQDFETPVCNNGEPASTPVKTNIH